ncbi:variable large family protein [Borreliella yangtzensis]|uniref:Variable large protein n=1 Tax=Borreliella yangtzensis TaxID=683292 RepID=A0ABR6PC65_9SPIR|nr:hypothetical protein [Borreliella yangtzensis]MBB6043359.1 hypothetical protein [Borreliella yangtzensis]
MKKMSSAILLGAMLVFANCKANGAADNPDDPTSKFQQSLIKLGNGFLDVFTSFGGLIADALGFKADPKKSEVKTYFDSLAKNLEETKEGLTKLPKINDNGAGTTSEAATGAAKGGATGGGIEGAINEINGWLEEMAKAAKDAAAAANGGADKAIGDVVKAAATAAKGGDEASVNGIANGIKGIVDAAAKAGDEGKLKDAAGGDKNADVGKLFANKKANDDGDAADAGKAAAAAAAVSGEQILKAIVDAGKDGAEKAGVKAAEAANPIDAAIGGTGEQNAAAAGGESNKDAGKLFAKKKADDDNGGGDAADAGKAAAAAAAVSGEQILKAIVDAAGKDEAKKAGVADVKDAENPIAAAIGGTGDAEANGLMLRRLIMRE